MKQLKKRIKEKSFENIMLLSGEEIFLLEMYRKKIVDLILGDGEVSMNYTVFSESKITFDAIEDSIITLPFLSKSRVVVLENSDIFSKKKSKLAEKLLDRIQDMPTTTYLILIESKVDKRTKLYKTIKKVGGIYTFDLLNEMELIRYIGQELGKVPLKIAEKDARYMIQHVGYQLTLLHNELGKLGNYARGQEVVTKKEIQIICLRSVENKIFELVACLGQKKRNRALKLYHNLLASKEPANRILFMLVRQFRLNHRVKLYSQSGMTQGGVAKKMKLQSFIVRNCLAQSKAFTIEQLEEALIECYQVEVDIRLGIYKPEMAVEQLLIKYG